MDRTASLRPVHGIELRYALVVALFDAGSARSIDELLDDLADRGRRPAGARPAKTVSDALRWELAKGRVVRVGRGRYRRGSMPRSTEWYLRRRLTDLAERATDEVAAA